MLQCTAVIQAQVTFAWVHTAALGLSQMADDRCPQLLLPLVDVQSLPPDKKIKLSFPSYPQRPTSPTCPSLIFSFAHSLFSIIFCFSCVSVCISTVLLLLLHYFLHTFQFSNILSSPLFSYCTILRPWLDTHVLYSSFIMELDAYQGF